MLRFYENKTTIFFSFFFCGNDILTEVVLVTETSSNTGTPFWRIVWVKTDCRFVSENVGGVIDKCGFQLYKKVSDILKQ